MAINDVYEVAVDMSVKGEHCVNVYHLIEQTACVELIPAKEIGDAVVASWLPGWSLILANEAVFNCVYSRRVQPAPSIAFTVLTNLDGDITGQALPTTSAAVVSLYTAAAGPSNRGRKYFAGLPELAQSGGLLEPAHITKIETLMGLLTTTLIGATSGEWELAVYSPTLATAQVVVASIVRTNLGTMRTRRQRPGSP